jgi:hypothetical protein
LPGVAATSRPTTKASVPAGFLREVAQSVREIQSAGADGLLKHLGIGQRKIGRGEHVEHLARGKRHHVLVLFSDAGNGGRRVVPPLLIEQEGLRHEIERQILPLRRGETPVLRQRIDAGRSAVDGALPGIVCETGGLAGRLAREFEPHSRREGEVGCPIQIGFRQRRGRQPHGETRRGTMQRTVYRVRDLGQVGGRRVDNWCDSGRCRAGACRRSSHGIFLTMRCAKNIIFIAPRCDLDQS